MSFPRLSEWTCRRGHSHRCPRADKAARWAGCSVSRDPDAVDIHFDPVDNFDDYTTAPLYAPARGPESSVVATIVKPDHVEETYTLVLAGPMRGFVYAAAGQQAAVGSRRAVLGKLRQIDWDNDRRVCGPAQPHRAVRSHSKSCAWLTPTGSQSQGMLDPVDLVGPVDDPRCKWKRGPAHAAKCNCAACEYLLAWQQNELERQSDVSPRPGPRHNSIPIAACRAACVLIAGCVPAAE